MWDYELFLLFSNFFKVSEFFKLKHPIKDIFSLIVIKIFPLLPLLPYEYQH